MQCMLGLGEGGSVQAGRRKMCCPAGGCGNAVRCPAVLLQGPADQGPPPAAGAASPTTTDPSPCWPAPTLLEQPNAHTPSPPLKATTSPPTPTQPRPRPHLPVLIHVLGQREVCLCASAAQLDGREVKHLSGIRLRLEAAEVQVPLGVWGCGGGAWKIGVGSGCKGRGASLWVEQDAKCIQARSCGSRGRRRQHCHAMLLHVLVVGQGRLWQRGGTAGQMHSPHAGSKQACSHASNCPPTAPGAAGQALLPPGCAAGESCPAGCCTHLPPLLMDACQRLFFLFQHTPVNLLVSRPALVTAAACCTGSSSAACGWADCFLDAEDGIAGASSGPGTPGYVPGRKSLPTCCSNTSPSGARGWWAPRQSPDPSSSRVLLFW